MEKRIPKRRFKEFIGTGEWEEKKLGEVCSFKYGEFNTNPSNGGEYPVYGANGVIGGYTRYNANNSIIIGHMGEYAGSVLYEENKHFVTYNGIITTSKSDLLDYSYIYFVLVKLKIRRFCGGSGQPFLSYDILNKIDISIPSLAEQEKIGNFFQKLDRLIDINREKLDKLKASKSAYLEEMFPGEGEDRPKRRFKGFTGKWEEKKWIDTVDISTNMVNPLKKIYKKLPHIGPGNIESFTGRLLNNIKTVEEDNLISGKFYFVKGDIIYGKINPHLGKYSYVRFNGLASADAYILRSKNELLQKFLFVLIQTKEFYKYSVSVSRRSGIPKINRAELNGYTFLLPSLAEQEKIGHFFKKLDDQIGLQEEKLEKLEKMKKAYLAEMFV